MKLDVAVSYAVSFLEDQVDRMEMDYPASPECDNWIAEEMKKLDRLLSFYRNQWWDHTVVAVMHEVTTRMLNVRYDTYDEDEVAALHNAANIIKLHADEAAQNYFE